MFFFISTLNSVYLDFVKVQKGLCQLSDSLSFEKCDHFTFYSQGTDVFSLYFFFLNKMESFAGHIQILHFFLSKKYTKVFQWLLNLKFLGFMTKWNPSSGNKTNDTFFHKTYSNLTLYIFYQKKKDLSRSHFYDLSES